MPDPASAGAPGARGAFVIGNVGKLGDELLNVLLESPAYSRVAVGVGKPMRSHVAKLEPILVLKGPRDWNPAARPPWVPEDLFLCIEPATRSFWKIDKPYLAITSSQAAQIAVSLRVAGARRVAIITPLEAILQIGAAPAIQSQDEMSIVSAGFERVLVLRPSGEGTREEGGGFFPAVGRAVTGTLGSYLTPKSVQPVRVRRAAELAVATLAGMADGVQVMGAARLRELVGDPMDPKRPY